MTEPTQTDEGAASNRRGRAGPAKTRAALVVIWASSPRYLGEVLLFPDDGSYDFGRGIAEPEHPQALFSRQRPGRNQPGTSVDNPFISRQQLRIEATRDQLLVRNLGKTPTIDGNGDIVEQLTLKAGATFEIRGQLAFMCVPRPAVLPSFNGLCAAQSPEFKEEDEFGLVGESPVAWALREHLAFLAERAAHVLLLGPSGSGKELAARAIHALSPRRNRKLLARNAATIPHSLVEAELFGNIADYPNAGMPERPGLVGEAHGSTLFLDEIGELPEALQTRLLRVLDSGGDYQRLGDAKARRADVRFVAATNRGVESLREDIAARLKLRLTLPGLDQRREDIPLIARQLARRIAAADSPIGQRFFDDWNGQRGEPRFRSDLMQALVAHRYATHVRELERLLWCAIRTSREDVLELTEELASELEPVAAAGEAQQALTLEVVKAALDRAGGVQERAWRDLGLPNRYVLKRLVKKYGLKSSDRNEGGS